MAAPTVDALACAHHDCDMAMPMSTEDRIRELHDRAVHDLIEAHKQRMDEPLVLAIRFDLNDTQDVHLLEVLDGFPGGDDDELLVTDFEPSAQLRILGNSIWSWVAPHSSRRPFVGAGSSSNGSGMASSFMMMEASAPLS